MNNTYYLSVVVATAVFCIGGLFALKSPFFNLATTATKQLSIILDERLEDREKDKQLLQNLLKLLKNLLLCLIILGLLVGVSASIPWAYAHYLLSTVPDTTSLYFYLSMCVGSGVLFFFKSKADYAYWSKLLHIMILDNYALGRFLLKKEFARQPLVKSDKAQDFVIVSGLARAGTTALMNTIFEEKHFHAIKYANVPFLLAPNLWRKIYNPKKVKARERAHKDSILFSEASIEALEEYFFKTQANDSYITENTLQKYSLTDADIQNYYQYQNLFREHKGTTYLAKNNNFMLRYESFRNRNVNFKMLLVLRDPLTHAQSLWRQHQNFVTQQQKDDFVLRYMNWLGHYEFGLNHKYFEWSKDTPHPDKAAQNQLSFWLQIWINYYSYVLEMYTPETHFYIIAYDDLANNPTALRNLIAQKIDKKLSTENLPPFQRPKRTEVPLREEERVYLEKANTLYQSLLKLKLTEA